MIRKCLFPVAGYGTRFLPATKAMPKEILPIVNKPLVQYGVEEAAEAGIHEFGFVTGRGKRAIEDHFDISYELETQIAGSGKEELLVSIRDLIDNNTFAFTRQNEMKGLGHAILTGRNLVGDNPFAVVLADDFCVADTDGEGVLAQMTALYNQFRCSIVAIEEVPANETHKYGVIAGETMKDGLYRITDMVEKPAPEDAPSNLAIIGRYILTPDIFDILENTKPGKNGEVQITDALLEQARKGCVIAYQFKGKRFDCGSIDGFVDATNYVYEHIYKAGKDKAPKAAKPAAKLKSAK
ncbi:MAG: UTP--glucose-1-phosphate uridylyltransferase [Alteromonadaceae bacterium]|uniref:UTP--glucose-1-phosphate uridylyltransferase GalU n=1 Tax=unclassified Marinobacter TaxID=83889 RepID=UPI000C5FA207|nr:UTP--glucose-1-phosphate uridylyltransferase GalU [Marinobacter sp. BGYM27]MAA66237.1 UTP--glucose-1-phosphate uridylyltransferase [Alteromonadaceae bacterium]MBH87311.1 UTP--glucose-1-phosphate uridylyltransferase [Alteromonadaceae bacterium]MDG5498984.1 UTP--glucose-1-phosphate uridylyltransferase GalU [Marinobacter sp. BGYM27]